MTAIAADRDRLGRRSDRATQVFRFLVVGGFSTVVTIGLFNLLVHVGDRPVLSGHPVRGYVLAMLMGLTVNFLGNRFWAFGRGQETNAWKQILGFLATNAVAIAIPSLCLAVSRYVLGLTSAAADNISANLIGLVLATLARWLAYRHLVFGAPSDTDVTREPK